MTGENVIFLLHRDHVVDEKIFAWLSWGTSPRIFLTLVLYDEVFFRNNKNLMNRRKVIDCLPSFLRKLYDRILLSDIGSRMARGAFWTFCGTVLGKFFVLIAGIVVANILGKEQYGELGLVRSTINMFVIFGAAGLGITATKYIAEFRNTDKKKVASIYILTNGFALVTGFLAMLGVLLSARYLANKTLNAPHLVEEIRFGAVLLFISVVNSAQLGTLSGFEDFRSSALTTFFSSMAEFIFMIVGAYFYGVMGALLGYGVGYVVVTALYFVFIRRNMLHYGICMDYRAVRAKDITVLYNFSIPAAFSSLLVGPVFWIVRTMLANTSDGYGELGIYEAADQWKVVILFVPSAISGILLPILTNTLSEGNNKSYWKVLKYNIYLNAGLTFVLALIVSLCASFIMQMYGEGFDDVWTLIIISFSTIFTSVASVVGIVIASYGKMWIGFGFNLLWAVLFILFADILLSYGFGAIGVAWALLFAYMLHCAFMIVYLLIKMKYDS